MILNNFPGTKNRGYYIVHGVSVVGPSVEDTRGTFIDPPAEYHPATDILVFVASATWNAAPADGQNQMDIDITYDPRARYEGPGTIVPANNGETNLIVTQTVGTDNPSTVSQVTFGNPVFPILQTDARPLITVDTGVVARQTLTWLVLRKGSDNQPSGDTWSSTQQGGFALSADSFSLTGGDASGYDPFFAFARSNVATGEVKINSVRRSNGKMPFDGSTAKTFLAIAVAASTNPLLTDIEWGFPHSSTYSSFNMNSLFTIIKVSSVNYEELMYASTQPIQVNGNTPMIGNISIYLAEVYN